MVEENKDEEQNILGQLLEEEAAAATEDKDKVAPDVAALERQLKYEKSRNDSLQGRMDAQIRPLNAMVKSLQEKVKDKEDKVKPLFTREELLEGLTPEEREKIGEKQLDVLARIAERPAQLAYEKMEGKLADRLKALEAEAVDRSGSELWSRVDQLSPGAKRDNDIESPEWVEFLSQRDSVSGRLFRELGNAAVDAGDVARLAQLHSEFTKGKGKETVKDDSLLGQLRPDVIKAEASRAGLSEQMSVKESDIAKFYADLSRGKYEGKREIADKMDALISKAIQEGRIISG